MSGSGAEIRGKEELKAQLEQLARKASGRDLAAALLAGALEIANEAKRLVPKDTRDLARSIHMKIGMLGDREAEVLVGSNLDYAAQREFGGVIRAKKAKALAFQIDGEWVFVKSVYQEPQPYLRPALDTKREVAIKTMIAALVELKK